MFFTFLFSDHGDELCGDKWVSKREIIFPAEIISCSLHNMPVTFLHLSGHLFIRFDDHRLKLNTRL